MANIIFFFTILGSINTADGSALVRMGGTTIVCGVKAEIAEPDLENLDEGFLGELLFA
jgi:exosome complex component RRP43